MDPYEEFVEYFPLIVQQHSNSPLALTYNMLYLTKGLLNSSTPKEARNEQIRKMVDGTYEELSQLYNLDRLPRLRYNKLMRIITAIKNEH